MVQAIDTPFGKEFPVPAGIKAKCDSCHAELISDGTERAIAWRSSYFNGKFLQETEHVAFWLHCPCDNMVQFDTHIRASNWADRPQP